MDKKAIYTCAKCGNIIESFTNCPVPIMCCGQKMDKVSANTTEAATEKHIPVVTRDGNRLTVSVGSVAHPMVDDHSILFIEVIAGDLILRKELAPGAAPEAVFLVEGEVTEVRAFCDKHGLWAAQL